MNDASFAVHNPALLPADVLLAEFTARVTRGIEQNIVAGWEGQRYENHTDTIPGGGVAEAESIDLFNTVETQEEIDPPIARIRAFNDRNNAF